VRDQGLVVGGVLSEKMFGPSVFPYQPEGICSLLSIVASHSCTVGILFTFRSQTATT